MTKRKLKNKVHYLTYNIYKYQVLTEDCALVNPTCIGLSVIQERLYIQQRKYQSNINQARLETPLPAGS